MKITARQRPRLALYCMEGRFDAHEAPVVRETLDRALVDGRHLLALDMSAVTFIDSTALAELVRLMKRARDVGGELILFDVSDPVRVILELTRLDEVLSIGSTAELEDLARG